MYTYTVNADKISAKVYNEKGEELQTLHIQNLTNGSSRMNISKLGLASGRIWVAIKLDKDGNLLDGEFDENKASILVGTTRDGTTATGTTPQLRLNLTNIFDYIEEEDKTVLQAIIDKATVKADNQRKETVKEAKIKHYEDLIAKIKSE